MTATYAEADFEQFSWHDCHIWGIELRVGDVDEGDWTSELVLDIDFIVEWLCGVGGNGEFRVVPASLVFQGVTDLQIMVGWGSSGFRTALHPMSIDRIERELIRAQKVYLDRPYYSWKIRLNWPDSGVITFGAVGFTQTLHGEPILTDKQSLSCRKRRCLLSSQSTG